MLGRTNIPYLDRLWHPTTGCSFGCPTCWARRLVCDRLAGAMNGLPVWDSLVTEPPADFPFSPTFHAARLADPLRATKPQVIGVSFLGDLFDPAITDKQLLQVWGIMAVAEQHTFVVLTRRAERMERFLRWRSEGWWPKHQPDVFREFGELKPLKNVWLGVSITNQADANDRVWRLLRTPAAHRWVSAEPLLGPVDLTTIPLLPPPADDIDPRADLNALTGIVAGPDDRWPKLDLVIAGGESGPQARHCHPDWARSLRDQCATARVPFNWKQWGEWAPWISGNSAEGREWGCLGSDGSWFPSTTPWNGKEGGDGGEYTMVRVGTRAAGRLLDGVLHDALPWRIER